MPRLKAFQEDVTRKGLLRQCGTDLPHCMRHCYTVTSRAGVSGPLKASLFGVITAARFPAPLPRAILIFLHRDYTILHIGLQCRSRPLPIGKISLRFLQWQTRDQRSLFMQGIRKED
jgi:hypothetical protein